MRAAPGGMIGGMMLGAVWFGSEDEDDADRTMRPASYDPLWDLGYAAYLSNQAIEASASAARPELLLNQFSVGFTTRLPEGRGPGSPSPAQLEAADGIARDMITHAVQTLSRGSIDRFDWIDELPIFEDLVTAIASQDMKVMRAGFVPWGVNPSSSGHSGFTSGTVAWGGSGATVGDDTSNDGGAITARPHGDIQPLRLPPPWHGSENVSGGFQTIDPQLVAMSGGSGGSGGGDPPVAVDDYYSGLHDDPMTVPDNGVLWNDDSGTEPSVSVVTFPDHDEFFVYSTGGGFTYTPVAGWVGEDEFTYTITNSSGTSDPATVTIAITNNAPVAGLDSYAAFVNTELVIPSSRWPGVEGVLANDADADGDEFTVSSHGYPQHGTVAIELDGSFVYLPDTDYEGPDSFEYTINDGIVDSAAQVVEINVYRPFVDLDTDSDNTGLIEGTQAEDDIEMAFPGKILVRNTNDDNGNLVQDLAEAPLMAGDPPSLFQDDDLFPIAIAVETAIPQTNGFTFEITVDPELKLWKDPAKEHAAQLSYTIGTDEVPLTLYVEGYDTGTGTIAGVLKNNAGTVVNQDSVQFLVVEMDIDVDSNNNGSVEPGSVAEDVREDRPGNNPGEVGARIFVNRDDDNENGIVDSADSHSIYTASGKVDNDFAEIRLAAGGIQSESGNPGLVDYELWLGVEAGLRLWATEDKASVNQLPVTVDPQNSDEGTRPDEVENDPESPEYNDTLGSWYIWHIESNGKADFPAKLFAEGREIDFEEEVYWRLVKPDGTGMSGASSDIVARDTVEISVEKIVWPFSTQTTSESRNLKTADWDGMVLNDAWYIQNSLTEIIIGDKGFIETVHPDTSVNGVPAKTDNEDELSTSTQTYPNGFLARIEYEFERSRNPGNGYVQAIGSGKKLSFVGNSGLKFGENASTSKPWEVAILDVDAMFAEGGATNIQNGMSSNGDVSVLGYATEPVKKLMTGIIYDGEYEKMEDDNPLHPSSPTTSAQFYDTLNSNKGQPDGMMTVELKRHGGSWSLEVKLIDGALSHVIYKDDNFQPGAVNKLHLQSHWGSGVRFKTMRVDKY